MFDRMVLTLKDELGVKHDFVLNAETLFVMQTKFEVGGVNFMKFLVDNAEKKKLIIAP